MNLLTLLQDRVRTALIDLVDDPAPYAAMVKSTQDARFGDYQANCAMALAKVLSKKPRDIAAEIIKRLSSDDILEPPEIAGPGFINFRFKSDWLARQLQTVARDDRVGVEPAGQPRTVVVEFSSPNVAKPMHVGHLRSTIIGDSLARLLRFLGDRVITDNHLGDWGLQFGMLLHGYKHFRDEAALAADPVREMVRLYVEMRKRIKPAEEAEEDSVSTCKKYSAEELARSHEYLTACRQEVVKLHSGDPENRRLWEQFMPWCMGAIEPIYQRFDVKFDHALGESFYNPMLPEVVAHLVQRGIARETKGAVGVFLSDKEDDPPALIRYRSGAYGYMTTDLATVQYRAKEWQPATVLYVVGSPQALHFKQLFAIAERWGYGNIAYHHIGFGSVLGRRADGTIGMLATREGGAAELGELLDRSVEEAARRYEQTRRERIDRGEEVPELGPEELRNIYEVVGLGAVKYADLSQNRESDYVFDWDKMLAMNGNTATYMQYAYVRNRGIFRKSDEAVEPFRTQPPQPFLGTAEERALALQLLRFPEALVAAAGDYRPNLITAYLWDLAKTYSGFFQNCPVLKAETPQLRQGRLLLCDLTARVIQKGLYLLGICTVERM